MKPPKNLTILWENLNPNIRGFIFIILASATFPIMGTTVKYLTLELHPFQIAFFRCFFGLIIILPLIIKSNPIKIISTKRFSMHLLRGFLGIGAIMAGFTALSLMPLATAVTLGFTRILFLVPLAMLFLGEKPGYLRILLIIFGFVGVVIIIDPSNDNSISYFSASLALLGAFFVSCVKLTVKSLSSSESTLSIQFYYGVISTIGLIIPCYIFWNPLNIYQILLILFAAICGTIGQMLTIWGLRLGATTIVMPADYTRLIFAALYGFILFNEIPYINDIIGAIVIIISTMIILFMGKIKK
jgi:drug/metabolite transporter (DMT)-like permease